MGHESTVYGVIINSIGRRPDRAHLFDHNVRQLAALPETDIWPFLTRVLFAVAGETPDTGHYKSQAIHFGGTFKAIEWEWHEWLPKFEGLLGQLFWNEVYLHLHTEIVGNYDYTYQTDLAEWQRQWEERTPPRRWTFAGGPRRFPYDGPLEPGESERLWTFDEGHWRYDLPPAGRSDDKRNPP